MVIGGASTIQQCLRAGLMDELLVGIMPGFLGSGPRFFDALAGAHIRLEKIRVVETGPRTDLLFRVIYKV
jgi:dihydrofolate reductase